MKNLQLASLLATAGLAASVTGFAGTSKSTPVLPRDSYSESKYVRRKRIAMQNLADEHHKWNEAVEAKRAAKKAKKNEQSIIG